MAISAQSSLPVAVAVASASPNEVTLVEETITRRFTRENPEILVADRAYDADTLDERLRRQAIQLVAPHRAGRVRARTQDGRELRRYKRRWKVERLFAWFQNWRRPVTRYEQRAENFLGFVWLACIMLLLQHFQ